MIRDPTRGWICARAQVNARKNTALLAELHAARVARQTAHKGSEHPEATASGASSLPTPPISVLTYNVW